MAIDRFSASAAVLLVTALVAAACTAGDTAVDTVVAPPADWTQSEQVLEEVGGMAIALSPDGRWLANTGSGRLCIHPMREGDGEPRCVTDDRIGVDSLDWADDSSAVVSAGRLLFAQASGLWVVRTDGSADRVTEPRGESALADDRRLDTGAAFLPGADRIVFLRTEGDRVALATVGSKGGDVEVGVELGDTRWLSTRALQPLDGTRMLASFGQGPSDDGSLQLIDGDPEPLVVWQHDDIGVPSAVEVSPVDGGVALVTYPRVVERSQSADPTSRWALVPLEGEEVVLEAGDGWLVGAGLSPDGLHVASLVATRAPDTLEFGFRLEVAPVADVLAGAADPAVGDVAIDQPVFGFGVERAYQTVFWGGDGIVRYVIGRPDEVRVIEIDVSGGP